MNEQKQKYWDSLMGQTVKTTPENVEQSHQGLFRATMNLPEAPPTAA